jgi:hypothetical protein
MYLGYRTLLVSTFLTLSVSAGPSFGWGDEGHKIVATVAASVLKTEGSPTLQKLSAILAADGTHLTDDTGIASEATWADKYRESSEAAAELTADWHFVNTDYDHPNAAQACKHPAFNGSASEGPSPDCVIDKVVQFIAELKSAQTSSQEQLRALQYVLHFVGDIHQPLHAIARTDPAIGHDDRGGNCVGILRGNAHTPIKLHGYWDTGLVVEALGKDPATAATKVMALLTPANKEKWSGGTPSDWANESYGIGKSKVYAGVIDQAPAETGYVFPPFEGRPDKCGPSNVYKLDPGYDGPAKAVVEEQLAKAGLRLAQVLKDSIR